MESIETSRKGPDRVTLGAMEGAKVEAWLKQIHDRSKFLTLNKSDVVNFFIREHREELSAKEIVQIRADHYDAIRHINWITAELKTALGKGDMAAVAMLQEEIKGIELSVVAHVDGVGAVGGGSDLTPSKPRKKRTKKSELTDGVEPPPSA